MKNYNPSRNSIFILVNSPLYVLQHLQPIIESLCSAANVYLISPFDKNYTLPISKYQIINIPLTRQPSILDISSLVSFLILRVIIRPKISISFTPKAGLINCLTSFSPGTTVHYFTGQRWATFKGKKRTFYMFIDKLIILLSRKVFCDSPSQSRLIASELSVVPPHFIGSGSLSGVDLKRFKINKSSPITDLIQISESLPKKLISVLSKEKLSDLCIFGFVGRVTKDKGIYELLEAFRLHSSSHDNSYLVIIGPIEDDGLSANKISSQKNVFYINFSSQIEIYLPCFSALILPSYREGFGSVILEAASCAKPSIVSNIPGPVDFVTNNVNGLVIEPRSVSALKSALDYINENPSTAESMGLSARKLVEESYSQDYVCDEFVKTIIKYL